MTIPKQTVDTLEGLDRETAAMYSSAAVGYRLDFEKYATAMQSKLQSLHASFAIHLMTTTSREIARDLGITDPNAIAAINHRLTTQPTEDGLPRVIVTDKQRQPTRSTLDDLKGEIRAGGSNWGRAQADSDATAKSAKNMTSDEKAKFISTNGLSAWQAKIKADYSPVSGKTITRAAFDTLAPIERSNFLLKEHGKVVD